MTIDYYPTLLEIAGASGDAEHNRSVDGRSLVGLLRHLSAGFDRNLFWHYPHYHAGGDGPYSAIRSGSFRLIEFHEDSSLRLFDLAIDVGEQHDLVTTMPSKAAELYSELRRWRESIDAQMPSPNPAYDPAREAKVRP